MHVTWSLERVAGGGGWLGNLLSAATILIAT